LYQGRPTVETMILPPFEFLVNCGKITFILYEVQSTFLDLEDNVVSNNNYIGINLFNYSILKLFSKYNYYFQDIHKTDCEDDNDNVKQPLLYLMINQPNIYFSQQHLSKKIQVYIIIYFQIIKIRLLLITLLSIFYFN
jgi:vacuolar protein sorting-associated protein 13B